MTACLTGLRAIALVLLDELRRERLVAERAAGQPRQLAVMAVVEDREVLAVAGEVVGQPGARERVGDRVGGEARLALLAVGDDRLARRLEAPIESSAAASCSASSCSSVIFPSS